MVASSYSTLTRLDGRKDQRVPGWSGSDAGNSLVSSCTHPENNMCFRQLWELTVTFDKWKSPCKGATSRGKRYGIIRTKTSARSISRTKTRSMSKYEVWNGVEIYLSIRRVAAGVGHAAPAISVVVPHHKRQLPKSGKGLGTTDTDIIVTDPANFFFSVIT